MRADLLWLGAFRGFFWTGPCLCAAGLALFDLEAGRVRNASSCAPESSPANFEPLPLPFEGDNACRDTIHPVVITVEVWCTIAVQDTLLIS